MTKVTVKIKKPWNTKVKKVIVTNTKPKTKKVKIKIGGKKRLA